MRYVYVLVMVLVSVAVADGEQPKAAEVGAINTANRIARLVGGVVSQTPGQNLGARFVEIEPTGSMAGDVRATGKEFAVRFPAHSHTTHETTLMNIIYSAVPFGENPHKLHEPQFEAIFSVPKDAQERTSDVERWHLASIKPLEGRKEQPKDAEKGLPGAGEIPIVARHLQRAVRLAGMRLSESRRGGRIGKFVEVSPQQGREFELSVDAARSPDEQTPAELAHTQTILAIIYSSFSPPAPFSKAGFDATGRWREPQFEVFFSIPGDAQGEFTDFTQWSLIAVKLPNAKKEQPKPVDK